jgi:hypothetical protein|tara:strand:+ start:3388 stop:3723 length:336 start_codon:yes stop_codon:yes gene_type:complete
MKTWIILLLFPLYLNAQNFKADISVVQFSASFTKDSEISLKPFKDYNTYTFYISDKPDIFSKEKIVFLPTIVLYYNNKEVVRMESDISLKLPDNTQDSLEQHIDEIIESKF